MGVLLAAKIVVLLRRAGVPVADIAKFLDAPSSDASGLHHWRSSFNGVPQLSVELDEPRLDLLATLRDRVEGCHVGFMMSKKPDAVGPELGS